MSLTPSTMLPLGTIAPDFSLPNAADGSQVSLDQFSSAPALLVIFMCNHCPYVKHVRDALVALASEYIEKGVAVVGISSNSVDSHPDDGPDKMAEEAREFGYKFPYLFDETQDVAKAYKAACTPDFFLFDASRKLVYRGQMDDSRPGNGIAVTGADLRTALNAVLAGEPAPSEQRSSMGCNIKWKPGNEPAYFG
ncbi:MAG: redoxin domain-containing protein [Chitinivibrionales bacterium]|nr:redoxin domain-containing protein [Chitinivibrionales bacterium]